ncbi:integrase catalytic domain-containing protein [Trichonephila clavipes]|nr:integrase catalytic domain-containing protein [Trichonephila clavipes]
MIPHHDLDSSMRELFGDISLADPAFYKSSPIDVLLGVDLTLPLLKGQTLFLVSIGSANQFWELDSVPCAKSLTSIEEACEDHFVKTHSRDENGRYTVKLPFHTPPTRLGNSKQSAIRRLISVERHLISNPDKYKLYRNFIKEYLDLKHMELVPDSEINNKKVYTFLTMELLGTPAVQQSFALFLTPPFRIFSVAICADVEKMFRQIKVHEEDVDWQRILWRDSPTEPIREYRLTTVTYGTSSAPFLSTRTLRQLAIDEQENYPAASRATLSHFYVDDLLSGSATKKGAIQLVSELQEMMKRGGFSLRKWVSNDPDVLATIPKELKAVDSKHTIKNDSTFLE